MAYIRKDDGVRYHATYGRLMEHRGYSLRIYWNKQMLDYLRSNYATMLNDELAGCLGVSQRTMIRKARELGLEKDREWLAAVWDERRRIAQVMYKRKGYPSRFKKGVRNNPDGEFKKGRKPTAEETAKRVEGVRQWCRTHPSELRARAFKAWETRRARIQNYDKDNS